MIRFGGLSSECHILTPPEVPEAAESGPLSDISVGVSTEFDSLLSEPFTFHLIIWFYSAPVRLYRHVAFFFCYALILYFTLVA